MPLETQILQLSSESLDKLFESTPEGSPNADALAIGKESESSVETKEIGSDNEGVSFSSRISNIQDLPDDAFEEDVEEETKKKAKKVVEPEDVNDDNSENTEDNSTNEEQKQPDVDATNELLKKNVEFLIQTGKWVDFEGREDLEITQEVYGEIVAKQDEFRLNEMFSQLVDSTGPYGKAIIDYAKNGGNPDEIIDLFKEQKQLEKIDTSDEDGKQSVIEKYYSEILGWKKEKVDRTVKRLISDDEINTEFDDVKELYDQHYEEELNKVKAKAEESKIKDLQRQQKFATSIQSALDEDVSLTQRDKQLISSSVFDFKHKLPNGQKVNDFYIKFAEMQADPKEYVEFVRFVMDKKGYKQSLQRKEKTTANAEAFNFIKGGSALTKTKSSPITINENSGRAYKGTDFSLAIKK